MSQHWSEYWKQGYITSFGEAFKENYQGEIKNVWQTFSKQLEKNAKILDIGTGNGALIDLIQSVSEHNCIGIDLAVINSEITKNINGTFISNISAENLPFEDNTFDAVVSQFALEYSDLTLSLPEILRVLKPSGKMYFVCHVPDSIVILPNSQILEAAILIDKTLLSELKLMARKLALKQSTESSEQVIESFIHNNGISKTAIEGTNLISFYHFLLQNSDKKIDFEKACELFEIELNKLNLRLTELVLAANNTENIISNLEQMTDDFVKMEVKTLYNSPNNKAALLISVVR